jgi:hypothetical protein
MAKADMNLMNELHNVVAKYYKDYMSDALEDGEEVSSGTLAAVNTFLKNNNITVDLVESDDMLDLGLQLREMVKGPNIRRIN